MEWSKAKNWLILLFLCINLFLIGYIINRNIQSSYIDPDTIQQTVAVLEKNSITIDTAIIPTKIPSVGTLEVRNALTDPQELATIVLGNNYTASSSGNIFTKDTKQLSVAGDMIFYVNNDSKERINNLVEQNVGGVVMQRFASYGFDMTHATAKVVQKESGQYRVLVEQTVDSYTLFDSFFDVVISQNGLHSFEGSWFVPVEKKDFFHRDIKQVKPVTSVLIDFLSDPRRPKDKPVTITDISLGYTCGGKDTFHKAVTAMPVWRITTDDGRSYDYDAR